MSFHAMETDHLTLLYDPRKSLMGVRECSRKPRDLGRDGITMIMQNQKTSNLFELLLS